MGSIHEIKSDRTNIKHSNHLTIHDSRDGGATWFRIAQVPRVHVRLFVASGQLYYHSGQGEDDYATDNGTTWRRIATEAEDTGWYLWNVPAGLQKVSAQLELNKPAPQTAHNNP